MAGFENIQLGTKASMLTEGKCTVAMMDHESGQGIISSYEILEGIYILYNDLHMAYFQSELFHDADLLCIDYCSEGHMEWTMSDGTVYYQRPGDINIDRRTNSKGEFYLPLKHYHGVTVSFFLSQAQEALEACFPDICVSISDIQDKLVKHVTRYIIRANEELNRIFEDIAGCKHMVKESYLKLKVMELLLKLDEFNPHGQDKKTGYFYRDQVETVKLIHYNITNDLEHHHTLKDLAKTHKMSQTSLAACFKSIYGKPLNAYMRTYRMKRAAKLLLETGDSIQHVALSVGYANPSKFSKAFKDEIGKLPSKYRLSNHMKPKV